MQSSFFVKLNIDEAVERIGDKELYIEIAHHFGSHLPDTLLQLNRNLEEGDLTEATRRIHSLKSNCATVGAEELQFACAEIEKVCRNNEQTKAIELLQNLTPQLLQLHQLLLALPD